jgi:hypothetical protein
MDSLFTEQLVLELPRGFRSKNQDVISHGLHATKKKQEIAACG